MSDDTDELTRLLAEATGQEPADIADAAEAFDIEPPEKAPSEVLERDWGDSPAYQDY